MRSRWQRRWVSKEIIWKKEKENDDTDGDLFALPEDDGFNEKFGLEEIEGGIGIDSCASDNVMSRKHLKGYTVRPSEGSRRGQKWGSASGHSINLE